MSSKSPTQSVPSNVAPLVSQMAVIISSCSDAPSPIISGRTLQSCIVVVTICLAVAHHENDGDGGAAEISNGQIDISDNRDIPNGQTQRMPGTT